MGVHETNETVCKSKHETQCGSNQSKQENFIMRLPNDLQNIVPSCKGKLYNVEYILQVHGATSWYANSPSVDLPVLIYKDPEMYMPPSIISNWNPTVLPMANLA